MMMIVGVNVDFWQLCGQISVVFWAKDFQKTITIVSFLGLTETDKSKVIQLAFA